MNHIWRYVRLYAYFLQFSFSKAAEFRFDFFFRVAMDFIYYAIHLVFFGVVFRHTGTLGGWGPEQMNLFLGTIFIADALNMTIFANNLFALPGLINRGDFDYFLLRPVSPMFMATLREIAINSAINLLGAVAIMTYFITTSAIEITVARLLTFGLFLLVGVAISTLLRLLCIVPTFWSQAPRGFDFLFYCLHSISERPDRIYGSPGRWIFTTVLPFALMYSYPARLLIEGWSWSVAGQMLAVLLFFAIFVAFLWRRGLRAYGSASS